MTSSTCNECLTRLLVIWPHRAPTSQDVAGLFQVYRAALDDLTDDEMRRATEEAAKSCTYFPTPAELRGMVARLVGDTTMDDLYRLQERYQEADGGQELIGPPADPERVRRMIADMLAEQKGREERALAEDYWRPRSDDTGHGRAGRLAGYPGKAAAAAILEDLRLGGPTPPPGVRGLDSRLDLTDKAAEMLRTRPERMREAPAVGGRGAGGAG